MMCVSLYWLIYFSLIKLKSNFLLTLFPNVIKNAVSYLWPSSMCVYLYIDLLMCQFHYNKNLYIFKLLFQMLSLVNMLSHQLRMELTDNEDNA
jgi:hypothetical protein